MVSVPLSPPPKPTLPPRVDDVVTSVQGSLTIHIQPLAHSMSQHTKIDENGDVRRDVSGEDWLVVTRTAKVIAGYLISTGTTGTVCAHQQVSCDATASFGKDVTIK